MPVRECITIYYDARSRSLSLLRLVFIPYQYFAQEMISYLKVDILP